MSPLMGQAYSGRYEGKLIWLHHTHHSSLWPPQGVIYESAVLGAQGESGAAERFRLRWTENAEHGPAMMVPSKPGRASNTWLINFRGLIEQSLRDLVAWVEDLNQKASFGEAFDRSGQSRCWSAGARRDSGRRAVAASDCGED